MSNLGNLNTVLKQACTTCVRQALVDTCTVQCWPELLNHLMAFPKVMAIINCLSAVRLRSTLSLV